jgi:uncharacterized damage-inducible protein DinB
MPLTNKPEVWLRGPLPAVPALLQPVAHALLQAREEVNDLMSDFPVALVWIQPAGVASVGFHLQHMAGVLERLFTYAEGRMLAQQQLDALAAEGKPSRQNESLVFMLQQFSLQVDKALEQLQNTKEENLTQARAVGRAKTPSTVLGLLVHAAEHSMRHLGQLLVTVRVLTIKEL